MATGGFYINKREQHGVSNPAAMSMSQLRELARSGSGLSVIAGTVRQALRGLVDRPALGWPSQHYSHPLDWCQTLTLVNGVRCDQAARGQALWTPDWNVIEGIREGVKALERDPYDVIAVADVLKLHIFTGQPLLSDTRFMQHPIKVAEAMADQAFAVLVDGESKTAATVMPNLARLAIGGTAPDFMWVDPYNGSQSGLSAENFCATLLQQDYSKGDATVVCTVA